MLMLVWDGIGAVGGGVVRRVEGIWRHVAGGGGVARVREGHGERSWIVRPALGVLLRGAVAGGGGSGGGERDLRGRVAVLGHGPRLLDRAPVGRARVWRVLDPGPVTEATSSRVGVGVGEGLVVRRVGREEVGHGGEERVGRVTHRIEESLLLMLSRRLVGIGAVARTSREPPVVSRRSICCRGDGGAGLALGQGVFQAQEIAAHLSDVADLVDDGVGHGADGVVGGLAALRAHSVVNEGVASLLVRVLKQSVRPSEEEPDLVQGVGLD
jgi:hypothetical protein